MATKAEVAAAQAKAAQQAAQLAAAQQAAAAAQSKLATFGSQADIDLTKSLAPRFTEMSGMAKKVAIKAAGKPDFKPQGFTLDEFKQKAESIQKTGTEYETKVAGITQAEQELAAAQGLIGQYSTPVSIPTVDDTESQTARQNAFNILYSQFAQYGLEALVEPLKNLILEDVSPAEFAIRLRQTEPYKKRFAANAQRINKGLRALSEGEYLALEDGYQSIMRNYGLPATYYTKGDLGRQEGFEKFIAGDVSPAELEERIMTAQNRVVNAPPQVKEALQRFYPDINSSDILAYTLDPEKGLADIRRKVTAAEIGGAAIGAGLATDVTRAEELAKFGVTAEKAREGFQAAVPIIERGRQLSGFYGESPYTQTTAEEELFGLTYAPEATAKRKRLTSLEQAQFAGSSGMTGGALSRDRAGSF
jgi:hypothetical protein